MEPKRNSDSRKIEKQIEFDASAEKVWQMLTDAQELPRWFPRRHP